MWKIPREPLVQAFNPQSIHSYGIGLTNTMVISLAGDPDDPTVLYAGMANAGISKTEDGGLSWRVVSVGMDPAEWISAIAVDPLRPDVVYAGSLRSGVYVTEDAGVTWRLHNDALPGW